MLPYLGKGFQSADTLIINKSWWHVAVAWWALGRCDTFRSSQSLRAPTCVDPSRGGSTFGIGFCVKEVRYSLPVAELHPKHPRVSLLKPRLGDYCMNRITRTIPSIWSLIWTWCISQPWTARSWGKWCVADCAMYLGCIWRERVIQ